MINPMQFFPPLLKKDFNTSPSDDSEELWRGQWCSKNISTAHIDFMKGTLINI